MENLVEKSAEKSSLSSGVKLGIGIAVLLSVTTGVGYLYGSYVKERRRFARNGGVMVQEEPAPQPQQQMMQGQAQDLQKRMMELQQKLSKLDDNLKMAVIQLGGMIEQQIMQKGTIDPQCVAGIDNLVYDLGEKDLISNNDTYRNMRRAIYEDILVNFRKGKQPTFNSNKPAGDLQTDVEEGKLTLEVCKNRAQIMSRNVQRFTADVFFKLLFCCQSETDGVNMIVTQKIQEALSLLNCPQEVYKNSYDMALQVMPQIRQISLMRMQALVTKLQSKSHPKMPEIDRELLIEVLKLKISAFAEIDTLVEKLQEDLKKDKRFCKNNFVEI